MTANGQPDNPRAARYILKDFVNGKLLYCYAPPNTDQNEFHTFEKAPEKSEESIPLRTLKAIKVILRAISTLFQSYVLCIYDDNFYSRLKLRLEISNIHFSKSNRQQTCIAKVYRNSTATKFRNSECK